MRREQRVREGYNFGVVFGGQLKITQYRISTVFIHSPYKLFGFSPSEYLVLSFNDSIITCLLEIHTAGVQGQSRTGCKVAQTSPVSYICTDPMVLRVYRGSACSLLSHLSTDPRRPSHLGRQHLAWLPLDQSNSPDMFLTRN